MGCKVRENHLDDRKIQDNRRSFVGCKVRENHFDDRAAKAFVTIAAMGLIEGALMDVISAAQ